ncbi:MAG TPA: carboxymuconolactone decarboxylase family protein [Pseudonocardiaceae bacterium]|nr:carboxymuconolactone decarboxylase family protein [Pseudonocardiaceae bacterium]
MSNLPVIEPADATERAAELLDAAHKQLGALPSMLKVMANSPALLDTYLTMSAKLATGVLPAAVRERLAITIAQYDGCSYCLSAHTYLGGHLAKIDADELERARFAKSEDPHTAALLALADAVVRTKGHVEAETLSAARINGVTNAEIAEVVGQVALNVLTNYFNVLADVEIDWPVTVSAE